MTTNSDGKIKKTRGNTSFTVVLAACSSTFCRRWVRSVSECTRNVFAILVPNFSDCTSTETRLRTVSTAVRSANCRQASVLARPCPLLEHDDTELVADGRLRCPQFLGGPDCCLVKTLAGFDTDDHQVQHVRKPAAYFCLPGRDLPAEPEVRRQKAKPHRQRVDEKTAEVGKTCCDSIRQRHSGTRILAP